MKNLRSNTKLYILKFLALFIPYFKRKMERATILNILNKDILELVSGFGYNCKPAEEIISDGNKHEVRYQIMLRSGRIMTLRLKLSGSFQDTYDIDSNTDLNPAMASEYSNLMTSINGKINVGRMIELLGSLNS